MRYKLEPYIFDFSKLNEEHNKDVLDVGEYYQWADIFGQESYLKIIAIAFYKG